MFSIVEQKLFSARLQMSYHTVPRHHETSFTKQLVRSGWFFFLNVYIKMNSSKLNLYLLL